MCDTQALDQVLRRHKTRGAVRAIIMMTALVQATRVPKPDDVKQKKAIRRQTVSLSLPMGTTQDEIHEIGDVFDMYDTDRSGEMCVCVCVVLCVSLNVHVCVYARLYLSVSHIHCTFVCIHYQGKSKGMSWN